MPIEFVMHESGRYIVSTLEGRITDEEILSAYRDLYTTGPWEPGVCELVDLSKADLTSLSAEAVRELETLAHQAPADLEWRCAVYAPDDLPYGFARLYEAHSLDSPENVRVFREWDAARLWIEEFALDRTEG